VKLRIKRLLVLPVLVMAILAAMALLSPMGNGNASRCDRYENDLLSLSNTALREKYKHRYAEIPFTNGDQVEITSAICDDSHSSMWGGNMVVKFPDQTTFVYMGHVCGNGYLGMYSSQFMAACDKSSQAPTAHDFKQFLLAKLKPGLTSH